MKASWESARKTLILPILSSRESSLADILEGIPPTFSRKPKAKCVPVGEDLELECRLVAIPEPEVTWFFNGKEIKTEKNVTVATDSDMHSYSSVVRISKITRSQEGSYTVVARNREGEASMSITVKVSFLLAPSLHRFTIALHFALCIRGLILRKTRVQIRVSG